MTLLETLELTRTITFLIVSAVFIICELGEFYDKRNKENIIKEVRENNKYLHECNIELARRNTKAIEYIQDRYDGEALTYTFDKDNIQELLHILKGSDIE